MSFPRYPEYKDSGAEWLGETPKHWGVAALKYLVSMKSGGTPSKDNLDYWDGDIPWASAKDLKVDYLSDTADHITQDAVDAGASLVPAGSLLVVVRGMILAKIFPVVQTTTPMAINQDLKALQPKPGIDSRYLSWLLRGAEKESMRRTDEAGHGTKALRMDIWSAMPLPIPPADEQCVIAAFLDRETAKLNELMAEQEKLITLLKEKRQAVIAHAVTKGLDPTVPMKDSGVEWLGEMPEHWGVIPLGALASMIQTGPFGSQLHSEDYLDDETPVINPSNIRDGKVVPDWSCTVGNEIIERLSHHQLKRGDIVFGRRGEMGRCAMITENEAGWLCGTGSLNVRLASKASAEFVSVYLATSYVRELLKLESVGSTMDNLNGQILSRVPVPNPPLDEQIAIADFVGSASARMAELIQEAEHAIDLLKERRAALISAAVTGQIDVRGLVKEEQEQAA